VPQPLLLLQQLLLLRLHSVWASKRQFMHVLLLLYLLLVQDLMLLLVMMLILPVASCSNTSWHQRITQRIQPDATSTAS
jgi:hypothetical protein